MTEPNHITEPDPDRAAARVIWPEQSTGAGEANGNAHTQDPAVDALLEHLGELPGLPVARHEEVYAALHEELLAALNEPVTSPPGEAAHEQA